MTSYHVQVTNVHPQPIAAIRARLPVENFAANLLGLFDEIYEFFASDRGMLLGRNIVIYHNDVPNIEVAVDVKRPITGNGRVVPSTIPGGKVVMTEHWGEYTDLLNAHVAVERWCAEHGHHLAGPNWEYYGHWSDDPANRLTEIFYLIEE